MSLILKLFISIGSTIIHYIGIENILSEENRYEIVNINRDFLYKDRLQIIILFSINLGLSIFLLDNFPLLWVLFTIFLIPVFLNISNNNSITNAKRSKYISKKMQEENSDESEVEIRMIEEYEENFEAKTKNITPVYVRKPIPQNVKDQVWNRDGGKCVECSSKERLEFDHIIPHSKGGADTYRNLQLLCQSCNGKKSNKIG